MSNSIQTPFAHRVYAKIRPVLSRFGILAVIRIVFNSRIRKTVAIRLGLSEFDVSAVTGNKVPWVNQSRRHLHRAKLDGVNYVADVRALFGIAESARVVATALEKADIHLNLVEYPSAQDNPLKTLEARNKYLYQNFTLVHLNPPEFSNSIRTLPRDVFQNKYLIAFWYWELQQFPQKWFWLFNAVNEIWVASRFIQESLSKVSPVPVVYMPLPITVVVTNVTRDAFNLPPDRYIFLFSFNPASSIGRKNPFGLIEAFKRAFGSPKSGPLLVVKMQKIEPRYGRNVVVELQEAISSVGGQLIVEDFSRQQMYDLINVSDCYVSLHRAEGLGLGMAEAMALGKPVIATNYSGNIDFMNDQNSYLVDYHLREITENDHSHYPLFSTIYPPGQIWAEPNLDHAAELMKRVWADPSKAQAIGQKAAYDIKTKFSYEITSNLMVARLRLLVDYLNHDLDTDRYK
jgi:glycosyltransferase involved in cell wall biosynthesis